MRTLRLAGAARAALAVVVSATPCAAAAAQEMPPHHTHADSARRVTLGAMAVGVVSHVPRGAGGTRVTEGYLTQPMVTSQLRDARGLFQGVVTLNAEGLTLDRGEINPGVYGEGYVDRRHPHTWLHELVGSASFGGGRTRVSLLAGKGFAPFGTDDPMVRPFVKYPVNHHLAQILERLLVGAAVRAGAVTLEGASFNGDEPEGANDWPDAARRFDSWASRLTVAPRPWVELQGSVAHLASPEDPRGFALDQRKSSAALRVSRTEGVFRYFLAEWAQTREYRGTREMWRFSSLLAEGEWAGSAGRVALRLERTERPEEDRAESLYRSVRPALDFNILGRTRWTALSVHLGAPAVSVGGRVLLRPFVEGTWSRPRATTRPSAIDPVELFGGRDVRMVSAGVRLHAGAMRTRFGRYGVAATP